VIRSFRDDQTSRLYQGFVTRRFQGFARIAQRKLRQLDAVTELQHLNSPPGNRLEALTGDRKGQHSIRINDQWHICFVWQKGDAHEVEIVDYH
jgi:proteic killer suppression protein